MPDPVSAIQAGPYEPLVKVGFQLRHVGVYAWRPSALARFRALEPSPAERAENLEQLRWLESGGRMRVLVTDCAPHGIDTPEDYAAFVERCRTRGSDLSPDAPHPQGAST